MTPRARWWAIAAWVVVLALSAPLAARQSQHTTAEGFAVPRSQSAKVESALQAHLPADQRGVVLGAVLVRGPHARTQDVMAAFDRVARAVQRTPNVALGYRARSYAQYGAGDPAHKPIVIPFTTSVDEFHVFDVAVALRSRLHIDGRPGPGDVTVHLAGSGAIWGGLLDVTRSDLRQAELVAIPLLLVLLLVVFGSLIAAVLPLVVAGASLTVTGAIVYLISQHTTINVYALNMASMVGLGVAIDYSLFVLSRAREEVTDGAHIADAHRTAMRTSGRTVIFSAATVVVSLLALILIPTTAVRSMALGAIVVVIVSLLACLTLLPALLDVLGERATRGRVLRVPKAVARLTRSATARPALVTAAAAVLLVALALPVLALTAGDEALRQLPPGSEVRAGNDAARAAVGPGRGSPLKVVVPLARVTRATQLIQRDHEVLSTFPPFPFRGGHDALLTVLAKHDGDTPQAKDLVARLRRDLPAGTLVGGISAAQIDFHNAVTDHMAQVIAVVIVLTFLMLLLFVRAPILALAGAISTLLSVAAAFGVLTAIFAWGSLDWLPAFSSPGYLDTIALPIVFAVAYGLSMDYQLFVLARIRERFGQTADTPTAIRDGVDRSAPVITAAAAIMIAVFAVFVATGVPVIQEIAIGAAVAILLDATVVRLALVPALMTLLGDRCWWTPRQRSRVRAAAG